MAENRITNAVVTDEYAAPRRFMSGNYYTWFNSAADTTQATTQGTVVWVPFTVDQAVSFDQVAIEVTTNVASTTVAVGIYSDSGNGKPNALLQTLSAGLDSASGTGAVTATLSPTLTLSPGLYWLAYVALGGTPTLRSRASGSNPFVAHDVATTQSPTHWALASQSALPASASSAAVASGGTLAKVLLRAV